MLALLASQDEDGNPVAISVHGDYPADVHFSLRDLGDMSSKFPERQEENAANRRAFFDQVDLNIRKQVRLIPQHQNRVKQVWSKHDTGVEIACDAIFTTDRSLVLTILAADALPIVMSDRRRGSFLALINGSIWSADRGIIGNAVRRVRSELSVDPARLEVILGPGICRLCYVSDVHKKSGEGFRNLESWTPYITESPKGNHINLKGFIIDRLVEEGVPEEQIHDLGLCTWHGEVVAGSGHSFFSSLRSSRTGEEEGRFAFAATLTRRAVPLP